MKTVEQIMGLAGTYAYLSETQDANGRAFDEAEVALRTAIEELHRDAARYQHIKDNIQVGAVQTMLPLYRVHHWHGYEDARECPDLDAAIDAAREST